MVPQGIHAWIILGKKNTRKGSVIRSITGVTSKKVVDVSLASGLRLNLWSAVMSLNEGGNPETPEEWIAVRQADCAQAPMLSRFNALVALRLDEGRLGFEAEDYVRAMIAAGVIIESFVTLGEPSRSWVITSGVPHGSVLDVTAPTNLIASQVRQFWGWI
jgi:hypothetical protein